MKIIYMYHVKDSNLYVNRLSFCLFRLERVGEKVEWLHRKGINKVMMLFIGRWVLPCTRCDDSNSCYWREAVWAPYSCHYSVLSRDDTRTCLANKKVRSILTINFSIREQYDFVGDISRKQVGMMLEKKTTHKWISILLDTGYVC